MTSPMGYTCVSYPDRRVDGTAPPVKSIAWRSGAVPGPVGMWEARSRSMLHGCRSEWKTMLPPGFGGTAE
jgi:hypothetical protein